MDSKEESSLDYTMNWLVNSAALAVWCMCCVGIVTYFILPGFADLIAYQFGGPIIVP
jgi:hypothetical protein